MASIGHIAVGLVGGRLFAADPSQQRRLVPAMAVFAALSLLPDADVVGFAAGVPYAAPFGHRGASHSLAFAAAVGLVAAVCARRLGLPLLRTALLSAGVVASHGLLDTLTDGGLGIALLWPFSDERFFAPWRPIPVAPIGARFFSMRGFRGAAVEGIYFLPMAIYALFPRSRARE